MLRIFYLSARVPHARAWLAHTHFTRMALHDGPIDGGYRFRLDLQARRDGVALAGRTEALLRGFMPAGQPARAVPSQLPERFRPIP